MEPSTGPGDAHGEDAAEAPVPEVEVASARTAATTVKAKNKEQAIVCL